MARIISLSERMGLGAGMGDSGVGGGLGDAGDATFGRSRHLGRCRHDVYPGSVTGPQHPAIDGFISEKQRNDIIFNVWERGTES